MRYGIPDSPLPRLGLPAAVAILALVAAVAGAATRVDAATTERGPTFTKAKAFDVSKPLRELAKASKPRTPRGEDVRTDRGPVVLSHGHSGDAALQAQAAPLAIPGTIANFEGLSNEDNFGVFGFRVNPPDPVGDVGPNHYVEMVNLVFGVFSKTGQRLLGPVDTGTLWAGFPVDECTDPSGDPIVIYDQ